jgi:hypothetical protein
MFLKVVNIGAILLYVWVIMLSFKLKRSQSNV